jgi:hypothetical protein
MRRLKEEKRDTKILKSKGNISAYKKGRKIREKQGACGLWNKYQHMAGD